MARTAFDVALAHVLEVEGLLGRIAGDPGGLTNLGISTPTWVAWLKKQGRRPVPVSQMTRAEGVQIYRDEYWTPVRAEGLDTWAGVLIFDVAVQSTTVKTGVRILQAAVGSGVDGVVGPATRRAVAKRAELRQRLDTIEAFCDARARQLQDANLRRYKGKLLFGLMRRMRLLSAHAALAAADAPGWSIEA